MPHCAGWLLRHALPTVVVSDITRVVSGCRCVSHCTPIHRIYLCAPQVSYAIGVAKPLSINVETYGTGKLPEDKLVQARSAAHTPP